MNRRSIVLWFVTFLAGFVVNFGTVQLMRLAGLDHYASVCGIVLGTLAVLIVYGAGSRWAGRTGSGN